MGRHFRKFLVVRCNLFKFKVIRFVYKFHVLAATIFIRPIQPSSSKIFKIVIVSAINI